MGYVYGLVWHRLVDRLKNFMFKYFMCGEVKADSIKV